jgi:hypothetical protein
VSVDDGNGGMDARNFFITVLNVDDPPTILTSDFPSATQDQFFSFNLTAMDVDHGDNVNLTWSMQGAPAWLHLDAHTGELSGTPTNGDVGESYLLVTVTDSGNLYDTLELILRVLNVNDPPVIPTADVPTATEDVPYKVVYRAADVDAGDVLTWTFARNASWLSFDPSTGVLSGVPSNEDVGSYFVNLTVTEVSGARGCAAGGVRSSRRWSSSSSATSPDGTATPRASRASGATSTASSRMTGGPGRRLQDPDRSNPRTSS